MNHYPRHCGDWLKDTIHLSEGEECIYSRMIDAYYTREAPLPLDEAVCCRMVRATSKEARKAVYGLLREFFTRADDGWHSKRCDAEIESYRERSDSAKRSVNVRWNKRNTNVDTNVDTNVILAVNQKPEPLKSKAKAQARRRATPIPEGFGISETVKTWAAGKGYTKLDAHLEAFLSKVAAKGYTYIDWDAAFKNCIREDWGKVNSVKPQLVEPQRHGSHVPAKLPVNEPHTEMPEHIRAQLSSLTGKLRVS